MGLQTNKLNDKIWCGLENNHPKFRLQPFLSILENFVVNEVNQKILAKNILIKY